jgi:choline dehydrogenase-like flavoprotein
MLSGLGPREHLETNGVKVIRDLPAVGGSLADHYAFPIMLDIPNKETLHLLEAPLFGLWHILLWLFWGTGLMSKGSNSSTIFVRSGAVDDKTMDIQERDPDSGASNMDISQPRNVPDIEVMIMAVNSFKRVVPGRSLFTFYPCITQPFSTGMVQLHGNDPQSHPKITHPMLRDERDWPIARKAIRFAMRLAQEFQASGYPHDTSIAFAPGNRLDKLAEWELTAEGSKSDTESVIATQASAPYSTVPEAGAKPAGDQDISADDKTTNPGKTWENVTETELDHYIRAVATVSLHPCCTARMSNDSGSGVVDQQLRVHGIRNLRIADTSVFPRIPSSHTMNPVIMVAERCADFIKQDWQTKSKTI